jgi:hypothetical protein
LLAIVRVANAEPDARQTVTRRAKVGLTTEAQKLLRTVDRDGAMPAFIPRNLRRIAQENGVQVKAWMTADNVIDTLRTIAC